MVDIYIPERGDIVWITLQPQSGHEQSGRRPAIVLSPSSYNGKVGLALFCPITTQSKGYPFEVNLPNQEKISGVILTDQVKSLDWRTRNAEYIFSVSEAILTEVMQKLELLFF